MKQLLLSLIKNSGPDKVNPFIEVLLSGGVSPNITDPDLGNISLLMIAISIGNLKLVETLIKYGADINFEKNVLSRCMFDNFIVAFDLILNQNEISKESIEFALFSSLLRPERIIFTQQLVDSKREICINARNDQNLSPLEFSKKVNNTQAIDIFEKIM